MTKLAKLIACFYSGKLPSIDEHEKELLDWYEKATPEEVRNRIGSREADSDAREHQRLQDEIEGLRSLQGVIFQHNTTA